MREYWNKLHCSEVLSPELQLKETDMSVPIAGRRLGFFRVKLTENSRF